MKVIKFNNNHEMFLYGEDIEQQYLQFSSDMDNFNICDNLIQTYIENKMLYCDVINCLNSISGELSPYAFNQPYSKLKKAINAYLSNLQPFLSAIGKNFDKEALDNITHNVYDNHKEYQFCYELRNVLQHKGFNIHISIENDTKLKIYIDKNELLEDFNIKAKTKELLKSYLEQIELMNELDGFYNAQCEILQKAYLELYDNDAHKRLLDFHIHNADTQFLYVGDYQSGINDEGKETLNVQFLHFDRNKILDNIRFYANSKQLNY